MPYYAGPVAVVPANLMLSFPVGENPQTNVPVDLKPYYNEDVWSARITATCRKASRYHKRALEWVWVTVSFVSVIAVPIAIYYVVLNKLPNDDKQDDDNLDNNLDNNLDDDSPFFHEDFDKFWKARLISFAVWVALMFLIFVPMRIWKRSGKKAVNQMLDSWEKEDRAVRPASSPVPTMRMKMPGVLSRNINFTVTFPPSAAGPSVYQPGANLPPYLVNPPSDPAAQAYYQPPQHPPTAQFGSGPMSGFIGQAPAYGAPYNSRDGAPAYQGYMAYGDQKAENPFGDEKSNPFEDVKV